MLGTPTPVKSFEKLLTENTTNSYSKAMSSWQTWVHWGIWS